MRTPEALGRLESTHMKTQDVLTDFQSEVLLNEMKTLKAKYNSTFLEGELLKFLSVQDLTTKLNSCCEGVVESFNALQSTQKKLST